MLYDDNMIIVKKKDVKSIKIYKGTEDYYKITLHKTFDMDKYKMKSKIALIRLLKNPVQIINMIESQELLVELRAIIDTRIIELDIAGDSQNANK